MSERPLELADAPRLKLAVPPPEESPIFLVDDEPAVRKVIGKALRRMGYPVREFGAAQEALDALAGDSVSLLVSDIKMPGMTGIELARRALEEDPDLAIIIFTGVPDSATAAESLRLGVADYLTKPVDMEALEESVQRTLRRRAQEMYRRKLEEWLRDEIDKRTEELRRVTVSSLVALVRAMEAKDPYLKGDSARVARLSERIARYVGLEGGEVEQVRIAGLLRDIGLIGTPESILHKSSKLTDEEYEQVKKHAEIGATILEPLAHLGRVVEYVRYHHERLNGSGYPEGRRGDDIPLGAQIVGLADSYVAITANRAFRSAWSRDEALQALRAGEGDWFQRHLLDALERAVAEEG